jgi:hypothetical protein
MMEMKSQDRDPFYVLPSWTRLWWGCQMLYYGFAAKVLQNLKKLICKLQSHCFQLPMNIRNTHLDLASWRNTRWEFYGIESCVMSQNWSCQKAVMCNDDVRAKNLICVRTSRSFRRWHHFSSSHESSLVRLMFAPSTNNQSTLYVNSELVS